MKFRTKTILFYTLIASTLVLTGAGLGTLFGVAEVQKYKFISINKDKEKFARQHIGFVAGAIITSLAACSLVIFIGYGLSYILTLKYIKSREQKLKDAADHSIIGTNLNQKQKEAQIVNSNNKNGNESSFSSSSFYSK